MPKLTTAALPVLKSALDSQADPSYIVDREYNLLWVNRSYRTAFGYRPRQSLPCYQVTPMGLCGTENCLLSRCVKSGESTRYQETNVAGALDNNATCLAGGMALYDPDGKEVVAVVGTLRDTSAEVRMHKRYSALLEVERHHKELLEKQVASRTAELVDANDSLNRINAELADSRREVTDILENISQAIMTIDDKLIVGREYSKYAAHIFGRESLYGVEFATLMDPTGVGGREFTELFEWLKLVFHSPSLNWIRAKRMVPDEYQLNRGEGRVSELRVDFEPIREGNRIKRLMVLVEDLTEKRELQRAIDAKQQEMDDNLDHLSELAQLDPEMYEAIFDEATEIVHRSSESLSSLRDAPDPSVVIDQMFRDMHTLKGNAMSFGLLRVAAKAHWVEDAFSELRESVGMLTDDLILETEEKVAELGELFARIQTMASRVLARAPTKDSGVARVQERESKVEIPTSKLDRIVRWAEENLADPEGADELRKQLRALSLVPLGRMYSRLPKMADDLAELLGKEINPIELEGEDIALAPPVFHQICNILIHLLNNSIDHGIEEPEVRRAAGRPTSGTVRVRCYFSEGKLCLNVKDDGAGMDPNRIVTRAQEKGLIGEHEHPTGQAALQLILMPGFSTATIVSDTSGRGVGMDAVKNLLDDLGGGIHIDTTPGAGTTFRMWIPAKAAVGDFG